jgi:hypothetical protein
MGFTTACNNPPQLVAAETAGPADIVNALRKVTIELPYMDAAAANVGVAMFGPLPYAFRCVTAKLIPRRALTADDTDYGTVTVGFNDGAGGSVTTLEAVTTKKAVSGGTGNWVAGTAIALSSIDRADVVTTATYLRAAVTKANSGVVADFVVVIDGYYEGA